MFLPQLAVLSPSSHISIAQAELEQIYIPFLHLDFTTCPRFLNCGFAVHPSNATMFKKITDIRSNHRLHASFNRKSSTAPNQHRDDDDVGELVTDAAPLDDQYERHLLAVGKDDEETTRRSTTDTVEKPTDESLLHRATDKSLLEPSELPALDIVVSTSPQARHRAHSFLSDNSSCAGDLSPMPMGLATNNTLANNVYQFSQINGLHIGSVYNIATDQQQQQDAPSTSADTTTPYKRTKTIDGERITARCCCCLMLTVTE